MLINRSILFLDAELYLRREELDNNISSTDGSHLALPLLAEQEVIAPASSTGSINMVRSSTRAKISCFSNEPRWSDIYKIYV